MDVSPRGGSLISAIRAELKRLEIENVRLAAARTAAIEESARANSENVALRNDNAALRAELQTVREDLLRQQFDARRSAESVRSRIEGACEERERALRTQVDELQVLLQARDEALSTLATAHFDLQRASTACRR
ncbi:MAG: hypothetical protein MHM6MM_008265, partial [Cercozoa sp. M6MM]